MPFLESVINHVPLIGTAKGAIQAIAGDTEGGIQAMKDSVKLPVIAGAVVFGGIGGVVMDDDDFNLEDREDAARGRVEDVKAIWNWGKKEENEKESN